MTVVTAIAMMFVGATIAMAVAAVVVEHYHRWLQFNINSKTTCNDNAQFNDCDNNSNTKVNANIINNGNILLGIRIEEIEERYFPYNIFYYKVGQAL